MPTSLQPFAEEIESGLPNERTGLDDALKRQAFFDYDGFRYEADFKRDAESSFDFAGRPHRPSGFLRECVEILTEHLYSPGPQRAYTEKAGDELLQRVWADNHMDSLMGEADQLSTLNDVSAIQIDAGQGVYAEKPVTYRLWGREQFVAWTSPDDQREPVAVAVRDKYDLQTRWRLWSDAEVWTFVSKKADDWRGGVQLQSKEPHRYGTIPFSFVHYKLPIRDFCVSSIGDLLSKAEIRIDDRLSRLDESINKHLNPLPLAEGVDELWKPIVEPGRFIRMPMAAPVMTADGYATGQPSRLYYLQVTIDSAGAWDDLLKYTNQALEAARVPLTAVRMEQTGAASGIAILAEQAPLLTRARKRRAPFGTYETDIARRTLVCCGNHYSKPFLLAAAKAGRLILGWPQPSVPIPSPDRLEMLVGEIRGGFKSFLMGVSEWYGVSREESLEIAKQIEEDNKELARVAPSLVEKAEEEEPGNPDAADEQAEDES